MLTDIRYALRTLGRNPAFTIAAMVTLALGVGATTAIFSAVEAAILRPLPFRDPQKLVQIWETHPGFGQLPVAYPDYIDWSAQSRSFREIAAFSFEGFKKFNLIDASGAEEVEGSLISDNFFDTLGIAPERGRAFLPRESQVILISDSLWRGRFHADPNVLGRQLNLNGSSFRVVGVAPKEALPKSAEVFAPLELLGQYDLTFRKHHPLTVIGRLSERATIDQAQTEISGIASRLETLYAATNRTIGAQLVPLDRQITGSARTPLFVLLSVVGLVLLIATANVAGLLLARAASRRKEIAVRVALGAGRARLLRQWLVESLALAGGGGVLGVLIAIAATPWLRHLAEGRIPRASEIAVDLPVLAVSFAAALGAGLIFGLFPALQTTRHDPQIDLREGGKTTAGSMRKSARGALVAAEVALAMLVLVSAALLTHSLARLMDSDPGFRPDHLLNARIALSPAKYTTADQIQNFYRSVEAHVLALPGVQGVAVMDTPPLSTAPNATRFRIQGAPDPGPGNYPVSQFRSISPNYLDLMRIPLVSGRAFDDHDNAGYNILVNQAFARKFFPGESALGRNLLVGSVDVQPLPSPIVGIVEDARDVSLDQDPEPKIYFAGLFGSWIAIRTQQEPLALGEAVRAAVAQVDRDQPVSKMGTMDALVAQSLAARRLSVLLIGLFAVLALALAAVGLYGVIAYSVTQRTRELGLRMALGASRGQVWRMVLREALLLTLAGLTVGAGISTLATRFIASQLYGISRQDPAAWIAAVGTLLFIAMAAASLPAWRATRVDPINALRTE